VPVVPLSPSAAGTPATPDRVPHAGSDPTADPTEAPPAGQPTTSEVPDNIGATWVSYLPPPEFGIRIFAVGLVALMVALGGLVTIAARRRNE
jgi:hypothetical protein